MNPWELVVYVLGWFFLTCLVLFIMLVFMAVWAEMQKASRRKKLQEDDIETFIAEATCVAADSEYWVTSSAFIAGARWAWGYHRRKR